MSDCAIEPTGLEALQSRPCTPVAFVRDQRFNCGQDSAGWRTRSIVAALTHASVDDFPTGQTDCEPSAFERGFQAGVEHTRLEQATAYEEHAALIAAIEIALLRIGDDEAAALRERLRQTLIALWEATVLPAALDIDALEGRIGIALAMLARAQDERIVRLNPADFELLRQMIPDSVELVADPAIERGGLRIDTTSGGVEDGPSTWRARIAEAIGEC